MFGFWLLVFGFWFLVLFLFLFLFFNFTFVCFYYFIDFFVLFVLVFVVFYLFIICLFIFAKNIIDEYMLAPAPGSQYGVAPPQKAPRAADAPSAPPATMQLRGDGAYAPIEMNQTPMTNNDRYGAIEFDPSAAPVTRVPKPSDYLKKKYFFKKFDQEAADKYLKKKNCPPGSFVLRPSSHPG